jgi:predicted transcriptional regulator
MPIISVVDEFKRMSEQMEELSKAMIIDPFADDFFDIFTRKRVELVKTIMNSQPTSIRDLAISVERDIKNVFEDLRLLQNVNIIDFESCGRCKKPFIKSKTIIFKFRSDFNE